MIAEGKLQHFKVSVRPSRVGPRRPCRFGTAGGLYLSLQRATGEYRIDDGPGFGSLDELVGLLSAAFGRDAAFLLMPSIASTSRSNTIGGRTTACRCP